MKKIIIPTIILMAACSPQAAIKTSEQKQIVVNDPSTLAAEHERRLNAACDDAADAASAAARIAATLTVDIAAYRELARQAARVGDIDAIKHWEGARAKAMQARDDALSNVALFADVLNSILIEAADWGEQFPGWWQRK